MRTHPKTLSHRIERGAIWAVIAIATLAAMPGVANRVLERAHVAAANLRAS